MNNIDWDDIDSCINCERQHDVSELTEINGDLMCESCGIISYPSCYGNQVKPEEINRTVDLPPTKD